jgi:hypothetical protein
MAFSIIKKIIQRFLPQNKNQQQSQNQANPFTNEKFEGIELNPQEHKEES